MKAGTLIIDPADDAVNAPAESFGKLFLRFLCFGSLAWASRSCSIGISMRS